MKKPVKKSKKRPNKQHVSHAASWLRFAKELQKRADLQWQGGNRSTAVALEICALAAIIEGKYLRGILR